MPQAMILPKKYFWDKNGDPLAYGKVYTYAAGTTNDKVTYTTEDGSVENTNPVILNGEGYAPIYLKGSYNIVVDDANDVNIWSEDPVSSNIAEEWVNCETPTYISSTSFSIVGDVTGTYEVGRPVRIDNNVPALVYSTIKSSSFGGGITTIVVFNAVVAAGIVGVCTSVIGVNTLREYTYDTVADMVAAPNLKIGDMVTVKDYDTGNNSGRLSFNVVASGTGTADGGSYIDLPNTTPALQAEQIFSGVITDKQFGAKRDTTDNSTALINAINFANGRRVDVSDGTTRVDTLGNTAITVPINIVGDATFDGNNAATSYFNVGASILMFRIAGSRLKFTKMRAGSLVASQAYLINNINLSGFDMDNSESGFEFDCQYALATANDFSFDTLSGTNDVIGIRFGNNNAFTETQQNASVWGGSFKNFDKTTADGETHGVLMYGDDGHIHNTHVENIVNSNNGVGAEGLYTKVIGGSVIGNTLIDAGTGAGSLLIKGKSIGAKRMGVHGNVLNSSSGAYTGIWIECPEVHVSNNKLDNFGDLAIGSASEVMEGIVVENNPISNHRGKNAILLQHAGRLVVCKDHVIDGCSNAQASINGAAVIEISNVAVNAAIGEIVVTGNKSKVPTNNSTTTLANIKIRIHTALNTELIDLSGNTLNTAATTSNIYDAWLDIDGTVDEVRLKGESGIGVSQEPRIDNAAGITKLIVNWTGEGTPEGNMPAGIGSTWNRTNATAGNAEYKKQTGTDNTGWVPQGIEEYNTSQLESITNTVNTTGKVVNRVILNTTTNKILRAVGTAAASVWVDMDGATQHTPV